MNINPGVDLKGLEANNDDDDFPDEEETPKQEQEVKPVVVQDDPIVKAKLIKNINEYKISCLGKYLVNYNLEESVLLQKSNEELNNLIQQIRFHVGCRTNSNFWYSSFNSIVLFTEKMTTSIGLKTRGLAACLSDNDECKELITEIMLKRGNVSYMEPEIRLGFVVVKSIMSLHQIHSQVDAVTDFISKDVKPDLEDKYKDL